MNEIDQYITKYSIELQEKLQEIRRVIGEAAPLASEKISWQMPTFYLNGNLVHFAMNKAHIGFYPGASGVEHFESELGEYKHSKGAIQFPLKKPLPKELITKIVKFRVEENTKKYDRRRAKIPSVENNIFGEKIEVFEKYRDAQKGMNQITECETFINGFRLSARIVIEALKKMTAALSD
jgi:uncharacterized protein YdhG (YjbR/CyaY superfamily)